MTNAMREPVIAYSSWSYATLVTSISAQNLSEWAKKRGLSPIEMVGTSANRLRVKRVMNYVQKDLPKPALFVYMGHGYPDSLVGFEPGIMNHRKLRMVVKDINDDLFCESIVHTIACYSVRELGPSMIKKGAVAYFGSTVPMLVGDFEKDKAYLPDFVDVFTTIPKQLIAGATCSEAYKRYIDRCSYYIEQYENKPNLHNVDFYIDAMKKNRDDYHMLGNGNAKVNLG